MYFSILIVCLCWKIRIRRFSLFSPLLNLLDLFSHDCFNYILIATHTVLSIDIVNSHYNFPYPFVKTEHWIKRKIIQWNWMYITYKVPPIFRTIGKAGIILTFSDTCQMVRLCEFSSVFAAHLQMTVNYNVHSTNRVTFLLQADAIRF